MYNVQIIPIQNLDTVNISIVNNNNFDIWFHTYKLNYSYQTFDTNCKKIENGNVTTSNCGNQINFPKLNIQQFVRINKYKSQKIKVPISYFIDCNLDLDENSEIFIIGLYVNNTDHKNNNFDTFKGYLQVYPLKIDLNKVSILD